MIFLPPGATQLHTYNVERDMLDAMLLRHASELGAKVLQGVSVQEVLFDDGRAVGVRARLTDGWEHEIRARLVIDASGRRCVLANQLGSKRRDPSFNQFGIYSWFRGVEPNPPGTEGHIFLHFLALERAWAWEIPLRNGVHSVGMVTDKIDFKKTGQDEEAYFQTLVTRNRTLAHNMRGPERVRPYWLEGDYSYKIDKLAGPGWMVVGDALRFVDPIFSTGIDVATYSASFAFEAAEQVLAGAPEAEALGDYERRVTDGVDAGYDIISLFYKLQNLFTLFAMRNREEVARILQGNLYGPEALARARGMARRMEETYTRVMDQPENLLRPGAMNGSATPPPWRPRCSRARTGLRPQVCVRQR